MTFDEVFCNTFKAIGHRVAAEAKREVDFMMPSMPMVEACRADDFDFFRPLIEAGTLTADQMHHAAERYYLGKTKSGCPIFWMIDDMLTPLDARIGDSWISKMLKARHELLRYWQVKHCLFGEHLANSHKRSVSIVESAESAVVLSEILPESIWMAYVYLGNLTPKLLMPLRGHRVTIYPRTDPTMSTYIFFLEYAQLVRSRYNIELSIDSTLEYNATAEQKERCIDILNFIIES
jgi:hypothetical protein